MIHTSPVYFDSLLTQLSSEPALLIINLLILSLPIIANSLKLPLRADV